MWAFFYENPDLAVRQSGEGQNPYMSRHSASITDTGLRRYDVMKT